MFLLIYKSLEIAIFQAFSKRNINTTNLSNSLWSSRNLTAVLYICDLPRENVHQRLSVYKPLFRRSNVLVTRSLETSARSNGFFTLSLETSTRSNDLVTRSLETILIWKYDFYGSGILVERSLQEITFWSPKSD